MPNLSDYFAGLSVSTTDIQRAETLSEQVLAAKYPDLDLRSGTGIRDLVIRPFATLMAMMDKALTLHFSQNTLDGVTDASPASIVDSIMSNWFLYRNLGSKAVINVRLYFARSKNITIPSDTYFSTDNKLKFVAGSQLSIPTSALTLDTFNNEYYYDVDLTAQSEGVSYNLSSGSLLYFSNFDPYFLRAEINYLVSAAGDAETNSQFLARAETAISTRNLINNPSIISNLQAQYPDIKNILPIGYGDPEMMRDQVSVTVQDFVDPILVHIGGSVDVYCRTPLEYTVVQLTTDANGIAKIPGAVIDFERSDLTGGDEEDQISLTVDSVVSSLTSSGLLATATTSAPHNYTSGDTVTIFGASPTGYNLEVEVTVTGANTFTYPIATTLSSPATGTIGCSIPTPFTKGRDHLIRLTAGVGNVTRSGTTVTVTYPDHGFFLNRYVTVSGASPSTYNGTYRINSVTKDTFTYVVSSTPASSPATGTIYLDQISYSYDWGFTDKNTISDSVLTADFGVTQANKTVSLQLLKFKDIDNIQGYIEDSDNRVLCNNIIARGNNIYYLDATVVAYNGVSPDAAACQTVITDYLATLNPGDTFIMSELIAKLNAAGITNIQTPVGITYNCYTRDMVLPPKTGTITDSFDPSDRTSVFYLNTVTTDNVSI